MFKNIIKSIMNETSDDIMERMLKDAYEENLFVMMTAAKKMTLQAIMEACMRGESPKPLSRTYGSPNNQSHWEKVFLNPRQLHSLPLENGAQPDTTVVIGKSCNKPINLATPIMITGMSYGASLSQQAKIALAKAATAAGTATNTGESAVAMEEREVAAILIGQYNRYNFIKTKEQMCQLNGIEIQLGQGAWGGAVPKTIKYSDVDEDIIKLWNLQSGANAKRNSRFDGVNSSEDIINLVNSIKAQNDVPVGVKIAASQYIEMDLDVILKTKADFITIDGAEGGTAGAPTILEDDLGLPTIYAVARASRYLEKMGVKSKYDIIAAGGLKTPGDFMKALALGANAVYIGSIALVAMLQAQSIKATPGEPTPQLIKYGGQLVDDFDINKGAQTLTNFIKSCAEEIKLAMIAMGKNKLGDLKPDDLVSVDKDLAEALTISYAGEPSKW